MILKKSLPSVTHEQVSSLVYLEVQVPAILRDKYYVKLPIAPQVLRMLFCFDDQLTNVSLFSCNYPWSGAQAMK